MGEQATKKHGAEGRKPKRWACCAFSALVLALIIVIPPVGECVSDVLLLGFLALRYSSEGLPLMLAWKDTVYMRTEGSQSLTMLPLIKQMDGIMARQLLHVEPGDDHITATCKVSMYTQMVTSSSWVGSDPLAPPGGGNLDTWDPVPTQERVNSYVQACREVYEGLDKGGPQRRILDKLTPQRRVNVTTPIPLWTSPEIIIKGRMERERVAKERPSHSDKWKGINEIPGYGHMFQHTKIRPVKEEVIDASEISEAVRQGKVAKFDATKLLGKELFNLTMPEIAALHGDMAKNIPMYRQRGASAPGGSGVESLDTYARKVKVWKQEECLRYPEFAPFRPFGYNEPKDTSDYMNGLKQPTWWLEVLASMLDIAWFKPRVGISLRDFLRMIRTAGLQCAVNTRRLPKLPMPKIEDALGNPDWLERAWSMFWLGPVADCWHYDDPDNLLIGVYGDIWVSVFKLKDRELMRSGGDRGCWSSLSQMPLRIDTPHAMTQDWWLEKFEFIHMKLTPGTGIVVPSGAYHSLSMADGDRILMNCFMIPKYKGLWDVPAANHSFYSSKWQTEEYHAMSQLKKSSIFRLWDTKQLGGYFEGFKLEMF